MQASGDGEVLTGELPSFTLFWCHPLLSQLSCSPPPFSKGNQQPVYFKFFVQVVPGECSPTCFSKMTSIPASLSLMDLKVQELGPCMYAVNCSHHSHPTPKKQPNYFMFFVLRRNYFMFPEGSSYTAVLQGTRLETRAYLLYRVPK